MKTDQSVPTWNYLSVHAYGRWKIVNDRDYKKRIVNELVKYFESEGSTYSTRQSVRKLF
ncbi:MAG: FMN-binding negative transcriptional regulator [Ignavibacteria bacterium]|nr:FMN-binding negative transcriptional regulator [Ignavibacteria bacterium]